MGTNKSIKLYSRWVYVPLCGNELTYLSWFVFAILSLRNVVMEVLNGSVILLTINCICVCLFMLNLSFVLLISWRKYHFFYGHSCLFHALRQPWPHTIYHFVPAPCTKYLRKGANSGRYMSFNRIGVVIALLVFRDSGPCMLYFHSYAKRTSSDETVGAGAAIFYLYCSVMNALPTLHCDDC